MVLRGSNATDISVPPSSRHVTTPQHSDLTNQSIYRHLRYSLPCFKKTETTQHWTTLPQDLQAQTSQLSKTSKRRTHFKKVNINKSGAAQLALEPMISRSVSFTGTLLTPRAHQSSSLTKRLPRMSFPVSAKHSRFNIETRLGSKVYINTPILSFLFKKTSTNYNTVVNEIALCRDFKAKESL